MGFFSLFFPWGAILQVMAIVHFIRRRPDGIWLWVIIFLGPVGAAASTLSETYLNYATFLASQNRPGEARDWTQRVLAKKPTMPRYLQRRERPWFRKASALLKRLPRV